jgi:hypothetical protein
MYILLVRDPRDIWQKKKDYFLSPDPGRLLEQYAIVCES